MCVNSQSQVESMKIFVTKTQIQGPLGYVLGQVAQKEFDHLAHLVIVLDDQQSHFALRIHAGDSIDQNLFERYPRAPVFPAPCGHAFFYGSHSRRVEAHSVCVLCCEKVERKLGT